jgi:hypothetical protein
MKVGACVKMVPNSGRMSLSTQFGMIMEWPACRICQNHPGYHGQAKSSVGIETGKSHFVSVAEDGERWDN